MKGYALQIYQDGQMVVLSFIHGKKTGTNSGRNNNPNIKWEWFIDEIKIQIITEQKVVNTNMTKVVNL